MKSTKHLATLSLLFFSLSLNAQLQDLTTLYRFNWQMLNPAALNHLFLTDEGQNHEISVNTSYRSQWVGLENGSPVSSNVRLEYSQRKIKLGGFIHYNQAGEVVHTRGQFNFAYSIFFDQSTFLSVGLNAGMANYRIDLNNINWVNPNNADYAASYQSWYPDLSAGLFFVKKFGWGNNFPGRNRDNVIDQFYVGLSVPKTFVDSLQTNNIQTDRVGRIFPVFLMSGVLIPFGEGRNQITLEPSTWVRWLPGGQTFANGLPLSYDVNLRAQYSNLLWLGAGYSSNETLRTEFGFYVNIFDQQHHNMGGVGSFMRIGIGFGADFGIGMIRQFGPSYEVNIGVAWKM